MKKQSILLALFLSVIFFVGCSKDSSSSNDNSDGGTSGAGSSKITFTMNGKKITADVSSATFVKMANTSEQELEIVAENNDYVVNLVFYSAYTSGSGVPTGDYIDDHSAPKFGYITVSYKSNGDTFALHFPESGTLSISSTANNKVTGIFDHVLTGGEGELNGEAIPAELNITNGVFTGIHYDIVNQ